VKSIDFTGAGYNLTGSDLQLTGGISEEGGSNTYGIPTALTGQDQFKIGAGTLDITATLSGPGTIVLVGASTATPAGVQAHADQGGPALKIGKANTNQGGLIDQGQVLILDYTTAASLSPSDITFNGGTLGYDGSVPLVLNNKLHLGGKVDADFTYQTVTFKGAVTLESDCTLKVAAGSTMDVASIITGFAKLTCAGKGTVSLDNNDNTYTDGTVLEDGTLVIKRDGALGVGAVELKGGTLQAIGDRSLANRVTLDGKVKVDLGTGTLQLAGKVQVTADSTLTVGGYGSLSISGGTLSVSAQKTLIVQGSGVDILACPVSGHVVFVASGVPKLSVTLQGRLEQGAQVDIKPGVVAFAHCNGTGAISVLGGTLDVNAALDYQGTITLEGASGKIEATASLGRGNLVLKGGEFDAVALIFLNNPVTVAETGILSINTGSHSVNFNEAVTLEGKNNINLNGRLNFYGAIKGNHFSIAGQGEVHLQYDYKDFVTVQGGVKRFTDL